jgi:hypothetical protein
VGTSFENGVADVTGCSQIGVVPFYDWARTSRQQIVVLKFDFSIPYDKVSWIIIIIII